MREEKNPIQIFKTRKYIKKHKDDRYYPYFGLETYVRTVKVVEKH